jgi:prolyl oligopeptidase
MEHGGVFAVANLRGGAEFGEDWHRAGMLDKKQNVFDDMIAAAEHLISENIRTKITSRSGRIERRLLMGAMITQRPDLFRAVVCGAAARHAALPEFSDRQALIPEYGSAEIPSSSSGSTPTRRIST